MNRRTLLATVGATAGVFDFTAAAEQQSPTPPAGNSAYVAASRLPPPPTSGITRHMVTVGRRQVHFRRAGSGPAVLMLHSSPSTSRIFNAHLNRLKDRFTLFALDTPGNGISDAHEDPSPDIGLYSRNLIQVMDALELDRCALVGGYTGGIITLDASVRYADRIPFAIVHGYLQITAEERQDFLQNYLVAVKPDAFGAYLTTAWAHFRDGGIFFPWYKQDSEHRRIAGVPAATSITRSVLDVLRAGDAIRAPYRSALSTDTAAALTAVKNEMVITMSPEDEMWPHRLRMPPLPPRVSFAPGSSTADCIATWDHQLDAHPVGTVAPPPRPAAPIPGSISADMVQVDGLSVYLRHNTEGKGRPVLVLHDTDQSSRGYDRWMQPFIGRRSVMAPDLPGRGETEVPQGYDLSIAAQAALLAKLMAQQRVTSVNLVAFGFAATVAVELAMQAKGLIHRLALVDTNMPDPKDLADYSANYAPAIAHDPYGAHLVTLWNQVRERELFDPWFKKEPARVIQGRELALSPEVTDLKAVDALKCFDLRPRLFADVFSYPLHDRIAAIRTPLLLIRPGGDFAAFAASRLPRRAVADAVASTPAALAERLEAFF